jgi:uncharacterized protein (TIGR02271 family)
MQSTTSTEIANTQNGSDISPTPAQVIEVMEENIRVDTEDVVTGKLKIRKTVSEETHTVNAPIINDEYEVVRVPVESKILNAPPPPVRHEGDTTIISVIREITVVEKRYEVIEEIRITRHQVEQPLVHEINLRKEQIHIDRESADDGNVG